MPWTTGAMLLQRGVPVLGQLAHETQKATHLRQLMHLECMTPLESLLEQVTSCWNSTHN